MKIKVIALVPAVLAAAVLLLAATASAAAGNIGFGFNATGISGFPTGAATLTGGGSYNPGTGLRPFGWRLSMHQRRRPGPAGRLSHRPRRSLGHGRTPGEHDLQVHRVSGGAPEDREHR